MRSFTNIRGALAGLLLAVSTAAPLPAQVRDEGAPRPADRDAEQARKILDEMSPEERERFRATLNEVWHSEEVEKRRREMQEANLAYRRALHEEIRKLEASSKVRSVLLRLLQLRFKQEVKEPEAGVVEARDRPEGKPERLPPLSAEEQAMMDAARLKAEKDPTVTAAKNSLDRAVTIRERLVASGNYRRAMRHAMEAADLRVKRIFARRDHDSRPRPADRLPPNERRRAPED